MPGIDWCDDMSKAPKDNDTRVLLYRPDYVEKILIGYYNRCYDCWVTAHGGHTIHDATHWAIPNEPA